MKAEVMAEVNLEGKWVCLDQTAPRLFRVRRVDGNGHIIDWGGAGCLTSATVNQKLGGELRITLEMTYEKVL